MLGNIALGVDALAAAPLYLSPSVDPEYPRPPVRLPPNLARYKTISFMSMVLEKDPSWARTSQEEVEYQFPNPLGGDREFKGFYRARGAYRP